jgi:hypothetical protein
MMTTLVDRVILPRRTPSIRAHLRWGAVAGLAGGTAMAAFLLLVGESSIRQALAYEAAHAGPEAHDELFSRGVQVFGGAVACLLYGLAAGAVFGVVYHRMRDRFLAVGGFGGALRLGAMAYLAVVLVPALKYPPNPPGVGDPATITARTASFITLLVAAVLITIVAEMTWRSMIRQGFSDETRTIAVAGLWVGLIGLTYAVWPANHDPIGESAKLIWHFRLVSLGGSLALWATLASLFGWIVTRVPRGLETGRLR